MNVDDTNKAEAERVKKEVEHDQQLSHAVEAFSTEVCADGEAFGGEFEDLYAELNRRAMAAGMVVLNTQFNLATSAGPNGHPVVTGCLTAQWMKRETLEALQRQERLMGAPSNGGPRRIP